MLEIASLINVCNLLKQIHYFYLELYIFEIILLKMLEMDCCLHEFVLTFWNL